MQANIPRQGEFYIDFEGKIFQIISVAKHYDTNEKLVIYQALYDDFQIYAMELELFVSKIDKTKYPNIERDYLFERFEFEDKTFLNYQEENNIVNSEEKEKTTKENNKNKASEYLLAFIDAKGYEAKKMALVLYKTKFSQNDIDCIYELLGIKSFGGNIRAQVASLVQYLDMQQQYEGERLRD